MNVSGELHLNKDDCNIAFRIKILKVLLADKIINFKEGLNLQPALELEIFFLNTEVRFIK
ncbi:hypothetical protein BAA08_00180 [Bizionia sp. APA-3]|nr:hypothetical protein BAA08_00180 [Bizionia sp. APA-3]